MKTARTILLCASLILGVLSSCGDLGDEIPAVPLLSTDEALFLHVTRTDPFSTYALFPNADSVTSGTLNGSTAHQPLVRVSMNAKALGAIRNGSLPPGARFPDGAVVFKEIIMNGRTVLYAVILKDSANPLSANGWLWAEHAPDGAPAFSVTRRGVGCVECHSREQGPAHDFVRTFERQR